MCLGMECGGVCVCWEGKVCCVFWVGMVCCVCVSRRNGLLYVLGRVRVVLIDTLKSVGPS